jgi:hypothetical protein
VFFGSLAGGSGLSYKGAINTNWRYCIELTGCTAARRGESGETLYGEFFTERFSLKIK